MSSPERRRDPWFLPALGVVAVLASLVVPMHCTASLGDTHYASDTGGAIVGGGLALILAGIALSRSRRGGPLILAIVAAVGGAAQLAHGALTMERVPSASETVDLDGPVRRVFEAMRDDHPEQIPGGGDATKDQLDVLHVIARGYARSLGRWQDISGLTRAPGENGTVIASGIARYERGSPKFELTFRIVAGTPLLAHFKLSPDRPSDAAAEQVARDATAAIAAGDLDRFHGMLDPRVTDTGPIDALVPKVHALALPGAAIELVSHAACGDRECFELGIPLSGGKQRVRVEESWEFGAWMIASLKLGDG